MKNAIDSFKYCQNKADALIMIAVCEKKQGNKNAAVQWIDQCIEKFPTCKEAYLFKA